MFTDCVTKAVMCHKKWGGDLFREKLSQRFCNYVSRIGLPVEIIDECNEPEKR